MPNPEVIYLKAWDIYQARISAMGEARWKVLMLAIAGEASIASYGYVNRLSKLYLISIGLCVICLYVEYLYLRIQRAYISKSRDVERALRDLVLEAPEPHIPRNVVDTDPSFDEMPSLRSLFRIKRAAFWLPYAVLISTMALGKYFDFVAPEPPPSKQPTAISRP